MKDKIYIGNNCFETVVAITNDEQQKGLMFSSWPPPIMTFPYNKAEVRKFWMKNTSTPLDILFCRDNQVIHICQGEPMSLRLLGPNEASDLVVEMPLGFVKKYGVQISDTVRQEFSVNTILKKYCNFDKHIIG